MRPTRELGRAALGRSLLGLAPGGACRAGTVARTAGELLPHRFTLTARDERAAAVYFLLRLREVAPAWVSPAPCPVESGLSSTDPKIDRGRPAGSSTGEHTPVDSGHPMRRVVISVLVCAFVGSACGAAPAGPTNPASPDQVTPDDAVKSTGARMAAFAFVHAYATETGPNVSGLDAMVGTRRLHRWVHWLGVQNREFPGSIEGSVGGEEVGAATPFSVSSVPGSASILRQVDLRAAVTFRFEPTAGDPVSVERSLDGPMRLVLDPGDGAWRVLDFTRDGIPVSAAFEIVKDATRTADGVRVTIDAFLSAPYWEFFLVVSGDRPASLTTMGTRLFASDGSRVVAKTVTPSLRRVKANSTAEGIATFPPQPGAGGLTLSLTLATPRGRVTMSFPLGNLIHPIPLATGSPSPSSSS